MTPLDGEQSIEEMKELLQRQLLQTALTSDNPQFKLDVFKAVQERSPKQAKTVEIEQPVAAMATFQARVRRAEGGNGAE